MAQQLDIATRLLLLLFSSSVCIGLYARRGRHDVVCLYTYQALGSAYDELNDNYVVGLQIRTGSPSVALLCCVHCTRPCVVYRGYFLTNLSVLCLPSPVIDISVCVLAWDLPVRVLCAYSEPVSLCLKLYYVSMCLCLCVCAGSQEGCPFLSPGDEQQFFDCYEALQANHDLPPHHRLHGYLFVCSIPT